jgi:hypothetical protein
MTYKASASLILTLITLATAANATTPVTFVSGKGANRGTCASPATPCRSFQFALGQTSPGGEIKALDPAQYGKVTITKSVSITGVEGAGGSLAGATDAITINAGPNDAINLSHLILDGFKTAAFGIVLTSGGSLTIAHCTVQNFTAAGIRIGPTGQTNYLITDTVASNNLFGISLSANSPKGALDHVSMNENSTGLEAGGLGSVLVANSTASDNANTGILVRSGAARLYHSAVTGNTGNGISVDPSAAAISAGNNIIRGNGNDVRGSLTEVGTQ